MMRGIWRQLRELGFQVIERIDALTGRTMRQALREF